MGKTFSRNRDDENYRDDMQDARQQTRRDRDSRHRQDHMIDSHMDQSDDLDRGNPTRDPRQSKW